VKGRASVADSPLVLGEPSLTAELHDLLLSAGYTGEGVRAALGTTGDVLSNPVDIPLYESRLDEVEPLGTLIKLLLLDVPVSVEAARRAFAPLELERLERLGLIASEAGEAEALVRLVPHDDLLIASDRRSAREKSRRDLVAGVHGPSLMLSHLTVRRPVETTLDVGTGNGIQAILAARHSERVVATDVNARALGFAAFNAELNGVDNIELRAGSFFEPAEGRRFDLVVSNPPYVISPETEFLFRDSGLTGDTVSRQVVESAPEFLEEGAFAQMLVSWVVAPGADWAAPLRSWMEGRGCDAWLLHHGTDDPLTYAANWLRQEVGEDPAQYTAAIARWLEYFKRLGIEGIAVGGVILRRRSGANWVRADELPTDRLGPASDHILRVFEAQDYLAGLGEESELLRARLVLDQHALMQQRAAFREREWAVDEITLTLQDGLGFRATLDSGTGAMLTALDGTRTLGEVFDELARLQGESREALTQSLLPIAARMLAAGFLVRST
jgi:methylase of polypeptide subunit release factors